MSAPETAHFAKNFQTLRQSVDRLRALDVAELDELVDLVGQASQAYQQCKARIAAVRTLLDATLHADPEAADPTAS